MAIPSKEELAKKEKQYKGFLSKLDEEGRMKEKAALSAFRSAVRKIWMRSPTKLAVLHEAMIPDSDPKTRTKYLYKCAICEGLFKLADVSVDHLEGENSTKNVEDLNHFFNNILRTAKKDLQVLCNTDHLIKTYSERYKVSWEEAVRRKVIIEKTKQTAPAQRKELTKYGFKPKDMSNAELREQCYLQLLNEGKIK